jgi:hypothetical protein
MKAANSSETLIIYTRLHDVTSQKTVISVMVLFHEQFESVISGELERIGEKFAVTYFNVILQHSDSSVGIEKGYWLDSRGSILGRSKRFFSTSRPALGPT